ncbi:MAG: DNA polymerase III subunit gamma/tau [Acidobacteriota bacterium]|nr:MAG: DNA polymerase III subunit gamma/tau [Acidobacteriota bacterium]
MSRRPLARTYRPQRFSEVIGQQAPVRALAAAAARGEVASAYIFSGTRGIGKTTIARVFAKALNCEQGPAEDCCDACGPCQEIAQGRSLDTLEMDAATHTGIDDVRELREAAQYPPSRERFRVFIIDEAHQLSQSAWNGLLKVLEEPPDWCVFLLCTTEPHKIPPTIESRALHFAFRSPPAALIREHLAHIAHQEQLTIDDEALDLLVKAADGSVRDGLSALDQARAYAGETISKDQVRDALGLVPGEAIRDYVKALGDGDATAGLAVVARLDEQGQDLRSFIAEVLEQVRRLSLVLAAGEGVSGTEGLSPQDAAAFSVEQLVWLGRVLDQTEARLRQGGPQRTLLDLATVRMTAMAKMTPLDDLIERLSDVPAPGSEPPRPGRAPKRSAAPSQPARARTEPPTPAPPANRQTGAGGDLLARLSSAVQRIRPPVASYLSKVCEARVDAEGVLTLVLPQDKQLWERKLRDGAGRQALAEAAREVIGREPSKIAIALEGAAASPQRAGPTRRRASPKQLLDRTRRDPLVRGIFERFGAVILESQALDAPAPADEPPETTPRSTNHPHPDLGGSD